MVRCMIRSHNQQYKMARGDDAENMCGTTLEPDPRYQGCCSNIFRPGKVLRDIVIGFLVVLAIAVVIAVLFVVCFYVLPESADKGKESAFVGSPIEDEFNINEVELTDETRYDARPEVVLENIRKEEQLDDHTQATEHQEEHHHTGSTDEAEPEPEPEAEPQPEPEPEGADHEHMHKDEGMSHEQMPGEAEGKMSQDDMMSKSEKPESEMTSVHGTDEMGMPHEHMHEHITAEGKMEDEHLPNGSEMPHNHEVNVDEMSHEIMHKGDAQPHDHVHPDNQDHMHSDHHDDMHPDNQDHMHSDHHDHMHPDNQDHMHSDHHDHVHPDNQDHMHSDHHDHMHPDNQDHMHSNHHDHMHPDNQVHVHPDNHDRVHSDQHDHMHTDMDKTTEMVGEHTENEQPHEHTMGHEHEETAFAPSAPISEEVLEVVGAPSLETTPELPTERTVISVASPSGPDAKVQIQSSESEFTGSSHSPTSFKVLMEDGVFPPLFETLGPRFNGSGSSVGGFHNDDTEAATETPSEREAVEIVIPGINIEEVTAPILTHDEVHSTEPASAGTCRKRHLEMCSDLPYGLTSLPNWANDQTEKDLNESSLPFFRDVIVRSGCSPRARQYACGILEPPCKSDGSIVPPCRTFCRSVAATCQEFVLSAVSLRNVFDCEQFPDSTDPSVCFDMTQEPCIGMEHRCGDGRCVARRLVCDGLPDCVDQSDEATCPNRVQAPGDEALVESSRPVPGFPIEQDRTPKEIPVSALPALLVDENQTEPVIMEEILPINTEEIIAPTEEYPTENVDLAEDSILHHLLTTEEVADAREEPSFLESLFGSETEVAPPEEFVTTEPTVSAADVAELEGNDGDLVSSSEPAVLCDQENFLCHDGEKCVARSAVCDGIQHCTDGSDESNCTDTDTGFAPVTSSTIIALIEPESQTSFPEAMGDLDMTTLSEGAFDEATTESFGGETTIPSSECPELQCLDGTCLALTQLNDGVSDCPDGTDEQVTDSLF